MSDTYPYDSAQNDRYRCIAIYIAHIWYIVNNYTGSGSGSRTDLFFQVPGQVLKLTLAVLGPVLTNPDTLAVLDAAMLDICSRFQFSALVLGPVHSFNGDYVIKV